MTVNTFLQPDAATQNGAAYKGAIDASIAAMARTAAAFAPHAQSTPVMTVRLDAGVLWDGATRTEVAAQDTGTITAPAANPRSDIVYIDAGDGTVGVATGSEAAEPADPALSANQVPVARINLTVGMTEITNADLDDLRPVALLPELVSQAEAEAGTATTPRSWTAARVAQAIEALAAGEDQVARDNIALLAMRQADDDGESFGMVDGYADSFADEADVDTATSSGENHNSAGGYYANTVRTMIDRTAGTAIGTMTTNGGLAAAFDGTTDQADASSASSVGSAAGTAGKDWGSGVTKTVSQAKLYATNNADFYAGGNATVVDLTVEESSDGSSWTVIGTYSAASNSFSNGQIVTIETTGATAKRYHRVQFESNGLNNNRCAEVQFFEDVVGDMVLQNDAYTADTAPATGRLVIDHEAIDSVTLNTDLTAEISRDGGSNWTAATLSQEIDLGSGRQILAGSADLSGQPSGTSMKWRLKTFNDKEQRIHGVSLRWDE